MSSQQLEQVGGTAPYSEPLRNDYQSYQLREAVRDALAKPNTPYEDQEILNIVIDEIKEVRNV